MVFILRDGNVLYILGHNRTYTLGRSRQNNIRIAERSVSSIQAKITTNNESVVITDLNSFHGTQVNGQVISTEEQLTDGDIITVGSLNYSLEFMLDDFNVDIDCNLATGTKEMLKLAFKELGIKYDTHVNFKEDKQCLTHYVTDLVTMQSLKNSPILLYLLEKTLIVTPKYFTEMMTGLDNALPMPNFYKFLPPVDEQLQSKDFSFTRTVLKANRRGLFQDILFISFHELGRLETLLTECDASVYGYNSGTAFFDTLYEMFPQDMYYCVLIHGPESALANIKICEMRLRKENWENVQQVNEDDLYLSILQCVQIGFKPVLGVQNCQDSSQPIRDQDDSDESSKHEPKTSQVKQQSELVMGRWVSKKKPTDQSIKKSFKRETEQVTSTTLDDDEDKATPPGLQSPVIQNKPEQGTSKLLSPIISVKEESALKSSNFLTSGLTEMRKPSKKRRSGVVINPLAIKRLNTQGAKQEDNLLENPSETPPKHGDEKIPKTVEYLSALQKKYKNLVFTPIDKT